MVILVSVDDTGKVIAVCLMVLDRSGQGYRNQPCRSIQKAFANSIDLNETAHSVKIERKAMIRNRYNYLTPPIRDTKGKETQTRKYLTLMETSLAESQTDSYFPTKWPNGYPKQKDVSDPHIQRRTITKINHNRRTALERSVKSISLVGGGGA